MLCMIEQPHAELCVINWLLKISDNSISLCSNSYFLQVAIAITRHTGGIQDNLHYST